ncbi:MAG: molybdenum ABC transporter ATP-binding protein [Rhizobiaceae bacterium]|nr:molybdenum ABC transporter ATP-binding protein [Rhizobiaceae bacterium]MCV0405627.1 molybdenum ABC transporter ATP-binding protein [Rhizobiaceae bacterium]
MELTVDLRVDLADFSLEVRQAFASTGITALFGPSGGGKSTLLRAIAGFERRAAGRIVFGEEEWLGPDRFVPTHRRGVGFVFQDARLFPHLSARGNLDYAWKRAAKAEAGFFFDDVVGMLDLAPLFSRRAGQLSGGERQRVAIGRTLLSRPRLLLMDEPLASLDTKRKSEILPYVARLPAAFGIPIIYVTHALEEVTQLADRIVALEAGRAVAAGGVAETLARLDLPGVQGRFEAGAVLAGRVAGQDAALQLTLVDLGGMSIEVPGIGLSPGAEVRLRVRARDVSLALDRPQGLSIRNMLDGRIVAMAPEADTAYAEVLIETAGQQLRARITRAAVQDLQLREGQPVVALVKSVAFDRQALPRAPADGGD